MRERERERERVITNEYNHHVFILIVIIAVEIMIYFLVIRRQLGSTKQTKGGCNIASFCMPRHVVLMKCTIKFMIGNTVKLS